MPDVRPLDDPAVAIADVQAQLDDFKASMNYRLNRRPTGDIEATLNDVPKEHTIILDGSTQFRTSYSDLWNWASGNGLVAGNLFGAGDGSTTFTLPDFRGRILIGHGANGAVLGNFLGAVSYNVTLGTANIPAHAHSYTYAYPGYTAAVPAGSDGLQDVWGGSAQYPSNNTGGGNGSGTAFNVPIIQPSIAINWLIWI